MSEGSRGDIWDIFPYIYDDDHDPDIYDNAHNYNIYDNAHNYNTYNYPEDIFSGNINLRNISEVGRSW